jgi:hypothetical protein
MEVLLSGKKTEGGKDIHEQARFLHALIHYRMDWNLFALTAASGWDDESLREKS